MTDSLHVLAGQDVYIDTSSNNIFITTILIASITGEIDWTGALCRGWMSVTVTYPIWTADSKHFLAHAPGFPLVKWGFRTGDA